MADRNASIAIAIQNNAGPQLNALTGEVSALITQLRAASVAAGQSEAQFLSLAGALSRDALAAGDAARAEQILADANRGLTVSAQQANQVTASGTRQTLQQAQAEARLQAVLGNRSGAARAISAELARQEQRTIGVINAERQLITLQRQAQGGGNLFGGLQAGLGSLGIAFGVKQLLDFGVSAGSAALQLRETKNALRAVAGDQATYNQILSEARSQQLLFGGSLQENINGLQGLATTARESGADLKTLIDLQRRLTVLQPQQGAQGARIALAEALAGNIQSLSRRFNIPRAELQALNDTTKPTAERLKVIDDFLAKVGITAAAVTGKVDQNALAFRRLGQELGDIKLNAGDQLATSFSGAATGLARLLGVVNNNPQAIAELRALFTGGTVGQADIDREAQAIARRQATATLFSGTGGGRGGTRGQLIGQIGGTENVSRIEEALTKLQLAGDQAAASGARLTEAFKAGQIPLVSYLAGLESLVARENGVIDPEERRVAVLAALSNAQADAADKIRQLSAEIDKSAQVSVLDAQKKETQQLANALLAQKSKQAVDAFLALNPAIDSSGLAALQAAGKIDTQTAALVGLKLQAFDTARALLQASLAQGALNQSIAAQAAAAGRSLGGGPTIGGGLGGGGGATGNQLFAQNNALRSSENQLALARAKTSAERIAILQRELGQTTDQIEKNRILAQIEGERNSSAKGHTSELGKQLNLEERIRDSKEAQYKAQLDLAALIIRDRQDRRKEDQELARDARIQRSGRASQLFKDAAADSAALIEIERQQRALAISEKGATVGGTIINGRIYQSRPGGGTAPQIGGVPLPGGAPATLGAPGIPGLPSGLPQVQVIVTLDGQQIAANVVTRLRGGLASSQSAGTGG